MKKQLEYINLAFSLTLGVAVFIFFGCFYRFHLVYQEHLQMFLFTSDYLSEVVSKPGGFSEYIARFFSQFYYYPWIGALIIGFLLVIIQRQVLAISFLFGEKIVLIPMTFIPSLIYWVLLCEEHFMLSGVISIILSLSTIIFYKSITNYIIRIIYLLLMLPALYWLVGGPFIFLGVLSILYEAKKEEVLGNKWLLFCLSVLLMIILPPLLTGFFNHQIPHDKVFYGVDFYRFKLIKPASLWLVWVSIMSIPLLFNFSIKEMSKKKLYSLTITQYVLLSAALTYGINKVADWDKEEVMAYSYYTYTKQWDRIIDIANERNPSSPLSVSCLNLALCKKGKMADDMFKYYQNGVEGLMPTFSRDFTIPMIVGEIYYHLGLINTAQRYAFEAMEAIPDYQKSPRCIKRLAETNIINENYEVAKKYLQTLKYTFFYKSWAESVLSSLDKQQVIHENAEWEELRKYRTQVDFLFSDPEKDMMLGLLLRQNDSNRMAYEYLLAYTLLTKNLQQFLNYYPLGKMIAYPNIPRSYQEALIYIWGLTNNDPTKNIPYKINEDIKRNVQGYGNIYTSYKDPEPMLRNQYSKTYWYYLHFRK